MLILKGRCIYDSHDCGGNGVPFAEVIQDGEKDENGDTNLFWYVRIWKVGEGFAPLNNHRYLNSYRALNKKDAMNYLKVLAGKLGAFDIESFTANYIEAATTSTCCGSIELETPVSDIYKGIES